VRLAASVIPALQLRNIEVDTTCPPTINRRRGRCCVESSSRAEGRRQGYVGKRNCDDSRCDRRAVKKHTHLGPLLRRIARLAPLFQLEGIREKPARRAFFQNPIVFPYSTKRAMTPTMKASPISVLRGLGLLVGRLSLIETCVMGTMGAVRSGVGSLMKISRG
jgi:hypothetical protein